MPKRPGRQVEISPKKQKVVSVEKASTSKSKLKSVEENIIWPNQDILELLAKIEEHLPEDDYLSYSCRLEKFDWENIQIKSYSTKECKSAFTTLCKQVRKYRLMRELITDMKDLINERKDSPKPLNKPKKPPNSYMMFVEEYRHKFVKENPTLNSRDVVKLLAQTFKLLPPKEKETYERQAKREHEKYLVDLQKFYNEHPELIPKSGRRSKLIELADGLGPPKKPKTPFELFVQVEFDKDNTGQSKSLITQQCRESWYNFTDKEKYFWINWAEELHTKYLEDLKEYVKKHPKYETEWNKSVLNKKEKQIKERCCGKPDKPPPTAYHLFCKMILDSEEIKHIDPKDCMNYVAERWRKSSDEEKSEYKTRIDQLWEEYHKKVEDYIMTLPPEDRDRARAEENRRNKSEKKTKTTKTDPPLKLTKPECPPSTARKYFAKIYKGGENPSLIWKRLSREEKDKYEEELSQEKTKYISLYEAYLKSLTREELEAIATHTNQYSSSSDSDSEESD